MFAIPVMNPKSLVISALEGQDNFFTGNSDFDKRLAEYDKIIK
jgi:hypothetical protein